MTLAEAVEKLRKPIMEGADPDSEMLKNFAQFLDLHHLEWSKLPDNDLASQKWGDYLIPIAKRSGWIRRCVEAGLLPDRWLKWPEHNYTYPPKLKIAKDSSSSVRAVSGGAFEQNRRKH